jgi:hypothetical protein
MANRWSSTRRPITSAGASKIETWNRRGVMSGIWWASRPDTHTALPFSYVLAECYRTKFMTSRWASLERFCTVVSWLEVWYGVWYFVRCISWNYRMMCNV